MGLKDTRVWKFAKRLKNKRIAKTNYFKALKMPCNQYEEYLVNRTYEMMLRKSHSAPFAYKINFENPRTFTEKRQWLKLYDQDERKAEYTDKYEVRKHIEAVLGKDFLIPLIKIDGKDCFDNANDIDFGKLPNSFVIKCTHGSHMNIIVKDKSSLSKKQIKGYKKQLNKWLSINYAFVVAIELQYQYLKPRLIIEEYVDFGGKALTDYKFFCFNGIPTFVGIFENRYTSQYVETYVDMSFKSINYRLDNYQSNPCIVKPDCFDDMVLIAKKLCEDFLMVRVDLYTFNNRVYFGELTFSSASGYDFPNPFSFDMQMGELIKIDLKKRDENFKYRRKI